MFLNWITNWSWCNDQAFTDADLKTLVLSKEKKFCNSSTDEQNLKHDVFCHVLIHLNPHMNRQAGEQCVWNSVFIKCDLMIFYLSNDLSIVTRSQSIVAWMWHTKKNYQLWYFTVENRLAVYSAAAGVWLYVEINWRLIWSHTALYCVFFLKFPAAAKPVSILKNFLSEHNVYLGTADIMAGIRSVLMYLSFAVRWCDIIWHYEGSNWKVHFGLGKIFSTISQFESIKDGSFSLPL